MKIVYDFIGNIYFTIVNRLYYNCC